MSGAWMLNPLACGLDLAPSTVSYDPQGPINMYVECGGISSGPNPGMWRQCRIPGPIPASRARWCPEASSQLSRSHIQLMDQPCTIYLTIGPKT